MARVATRFGRHLAGLGLALALAAAGPGRAAEADPWQACAEAARRAEAEARLPENMLQAITQTEAGRLHPWTREIKPWPWTLGRAGERLFYASPGDALAALEGFWAAGERALGVGCLQVDLARHPRAFTGLAEALDPAANARAAARILAHRRRTEGGWEAALEGYRDSDPKAGRIYRIAIFDAWARIQVAQAAFLEASAVAPERLGAPESTVAAGPPADGPLLAPRQGRARWTRQDTLPAHWRSPALPRTVDLANGAGSTAPPLVQEVVIAVDLAPRAADRLAYGDRPPPGPALRLAAAP